VKTREKRAVGGHTCLKEVILWLLVVVSEKAPKTCNDEKFILSHLEDGGLLKSNVEIELEVGNAGSMIGFATQKIFAHSREKALSGALYN